MAFKISEVTGADGYTAHRTVSVADVFPFNAATPVEAGGAAKEIFVLANFNQPSGPSSCKLIKATVLNGYTHLSESSPAFTTNSEWRVDHSGGPFTINVVALSGAASVSLSTRAG